MRVHVSYTMTKGLPERSQLKTEPQHRLAPVLISMSHTAFSGLDCLICQAPLTCTDALYCHERSIRRVRRHHRWWGVCCTCLESALLIERGLYSGLTWTGEELKLKLGTSLESWCIRCGYCGSRLTTSEKQRHELKEEAYLQVRNGFRGRCWDCASRSDGSRPPFG